jgi:hypothetical protein
VLVPEHKWINVESFEALLALFIGSIASIGGYYSIPQSCRPFYSGSERCFFSGSGGVEALGLLIIGLVFVTIGIGDFALRMRPHHN